MYKRKILEDTPSSETWSFRHLFNSRKRPFLGPTTRIEGKVRINFLICERVCISANSDYCILGKLDWVWRPPRDHVRQAVLPARWRVTRCARDHDPAPPLRRAGPDPADLLPAALGGGEPRAQAGQGGGRLGSGQRGLHAAGECRYRANLPWHCYTKAVQQLGYFMSDVSNVSEYRREQMNYYSALFLTKSYWANSSSPVDASLCQWKERDCHHPLPLELGRGENKKYCRADSRPTCWHVLLSRV